MTASLDLDAVYASICEQAVLVALAHMAMTDWFIPDRNQRPDVINQARTEPYVAMAANFIKERIPQEWKDRATAVFNANKFERRFRDAHNVVTGDDFFRAVVGH